MKIKELFEGIDDNEYSEDEDVSQYIVNYLVVLKANGVEKVPTVSVIQEVLKNSDLHITFETLQRILKDQPFIAEMNSSFITLKMEDDLINDSPDMSKDTVSDMAKMAFRKRNK